jgi:SAM-dependent methyltransferase
MTDWARYYKTRYVPDPRRSVVWKAICEWLQREIPSDGTVLELGAGYCDFINNIRAARKVAVDINEDVRKSAAEGVETHVGSCGHLPFVVGASVDAVFTSNLFEHLERRELRDTLSEILRVLKPGGKLLVIQPNFRYCFREYFDDYTHVAVFTDLSLPDLLAASGFEISRVEPRFMPFSLKSGLPVHPLLVRLYLRSPWRPRAGQMLVVARKA